MSLKLLELTQFAWPNLSIYFNFLCAVPRNDVIESIRFLMRPPVNHSTMLTTKPEINRSIDLKWLAASISFYFATHNCVISANNSNWTLFSDVSASCCPTLPLAARQTQLTQSLFIYIAAMTLHILLPPSFSAILFACTDHCVCVRLLLQRVSSPAGDPSTCLLMIHFTSPLINVS